MSQLIQILCPASYSKCHCILCHGILFHPCPPSLHVKYPHLLVPSQIQECVSWHQASQSLLLILCQDFVSSQSVLRFLNIPFLTGLSQLQKYSLSCIIFMFSFPIAFPLPLRVVSSNKILRYPFSYLLFKKYFCDSFGGCHIKCICTVFILLPPAAKTNQSSNSTLSFFFVLRDHSIQTLETSQG